MALREILAKFSIEVDSGELDRALVSINDMVGTIRQLVSQVNQVDEENIEDLGEASAEAAHDVDKLGREVTQAGRDAQRSGGWFSGFRQQIMALAPAIGATALVAGFASFTEEVDKLAKQSRALNIPIDQLQAWRRAANRAGLETAVLETGLSKIQKKAFDSTQTGGALASAFDRLGVSVKNNDGTFKGADALFQEVGAGLAGLDDSTERTALAMLLFEEQGAKFLNLFGQSPEAIKATLDEMQELGGVTEEYAADVEAMNDAWGDVKIAFMGAVVAITGSLIPAFTWMSERMERATVVFRRVTEGTHLLQAGLVVMAGVVTAKAIPALTAWAIANKAVLISMAPWIAAAALGVLVIDDLITAITGGESLIGDAMSRIADGQFLEDLMFIADEFIMWLGEWTGKIGADFGFIADQIGEVFSGLFRGISEGARGMVDGVVRFFEELAQRVVDGVSSAISKGRALLERLPGASLFFGSEGGAATAPAPAAGGGNTQNVKQENQITVNVPPGTPAELAQNVGRAVRSAVSPGLQPAQASLAPGF